MQLMKIGEIKYLRKFKLYIDCNSKTSRFAKLSTRCVQKGSHFQFTKICPLKIKVFNGSLDRTRKERNQYWREGAELTLLELEHCVQHLPGNGLLPSVVS